MKKFRLRINRNKEILFSIEKGKVFLNAENYNLIIEENLTEEELIKIANLKKTKVN
jgi:hypothetical protein